MDATSALKSSNRPPTLSFLTLHLGSFTSLSPESFPSPTSSSRISPISPIAPNSGNSPSRSGFRWDEQAQQSGTSGPPFDTGQGYNGSVVLPRSSSSRDGFGSLTARRESSRSPLRTNGSIQPSQPSQPSADLSLPQIPSLSPISPISPHQESASTTNKNLGLALPLSVTGRSPSWTPGSAPSPSGSRTMPVESSRGHPLGPSLTIHSPSPLTPSSSIDNNGPPSPAVLRDSPLPRRRTIVESNPASSRSSPVKVSDVIGSLTPPQDASPEVPARRSSHDRGTMSMPVARPLTIVDTSFNSGDGSPKRLADKTSISDLKRVSPISPTSRRSLPRPPTGDRGSLAQPSIPKLRSLSNSIPPGAQSSALTTHPSQPPATSSTWPPLPGSHVSLAVPDTPQRAAAKLQHQSLVQKPQTTNSASSLPIVAGLADAGPYPSSPALTPRQPGPSNQGTAGISRTTQAGPSRPGQNPGPGPGGAAPQEEICLECMMRDRDLADVVVQGDGAWERGSDAAWEELQWREDALLKSIGSGSTMSRSVPSLDHSSDSESADHSTTSPPSTGHSFEDAGARQRMAVRRRNRALRRARRRELDWRVIKEIGWRGFRWEEGSAGEGLPSGFRGSRGGQLTQGGIKAIMTKFPSASQHRYENLHTYLCYQAVLVREIQLETQRLGHYLQPGDVPISSMLSYDGHNIIAGPRTSSVAWEAKHARELSEQLRGAFTSPQRAPQLSLVRPSPSSPAELANIANGRPVPPPLTRPLTQSYPDCGPGVTAHISPTSFTQPLNMRADHSMHGNGFKNPAFRQNEDWPEDDEELWEPSSAADGGLRPFSFAVRAGATATRGSSDGHGRRSLWGRWGGSVTSLFGGSHGDSGSMVDMHLGLDNEQRERNSSNQIHSHPRAVSLASPTRPSFFWRQSGASSIEIDRDRNSRLVQSISSSRLSQMMLNESDDDEHVAKKKGFKALLRKMKPNANRKSSGRTDQHVPSPRPDEEISDLGTPLAPPPPIPYLVARGDKSHGRDRSESVSSLQTDVSTAAAGGQKRISGSLPLGLRSVSAPQAGSSSGSQSVSPTSSRLNSSAPRRESYVSMQGRDRRGSTTINEVGVRTDRHGTTMEMLSNGRFLASPEPAPMNFDEPSPMPRGAANAVPAHVSPHVATYPPPTSRPNNKTTSSLSASTFIETPPAVPASAPFFDPRNRNDDVVQSASGNLSPNRYKNLPPLPAPGQEAPYSASPESFAAAFPDQPDFSLAAARYDRSPRKTGRIFAAPSANFSSAQRSIDKYPFQPSRTSFDPVGDRPIRRPGEITPRLAQSLYVQPSVAGSTGSFGRFVGVAGKRQESGTVIDLSDGKSVRGKKGFKGFFGRTGKVA